MSNIDKAIDALRKGRFILMHDFDNREGETDLVISAEFVTPEKVKVMRKDGGGLICIAIGKELSKKLGLPLMTDIHKASKNKYPVLSHLKEKGLKYDTRSSFSVTIDHRDTFTGISDKERAFTIREFGLLCKKNPNPMDFGRKFMSPGHVYLLVSSGLRKRQGHTELSAELMELAGLIPTIVICEMLDDKTHKSLSKKKALEYAKKHNLVFVDGDEIRLRCR